VAAPSLIGPRTHSPNASDLYGIADNGAPLVQVGAMAPYTDPNQVNSASEVGLRLLRQDGSIALDPIAGILAGVMTRLAYVGGGVNQSVPGGSTDVLATGSTISFLLERPQSVLFAFGLTFNATGDYAYGSAVVDGASVGSEGRHVFIANTLSYNSGTFHYPVSLAAGTHTADITISTDAGITALIWDVQLLALQMGG